MTPITRYTEMEMSLSLVDLIYTQMQYRCYE